jgi:3',5'-cyclic AMP phosphodiesterase CpdA
MRFFHLSDWHVGSAKFFQEENLLKAIDEINSGDYEFVIHTGDVTHEGQRDEYEAAMPFYEKIEKPIVTVPGNHDGRSGGLTLFEEYIGPTNNVVELGDAIFVYVSSIIADSNAGRVGRVKYDMIREAFNKYRDKPIKILGVHHHILPVPKSGRERNTLANAGDLLDLILRTDVDMVLSGHRHFPNVYSVEDTVIVNAGTVSSGKTRHGDVNSYNVIEIDDDCKRIITKRVDGREDTVEFPRESRRVFSSFGQREYRIVHLSNTFISDTRSFRKKHFDNAINRINALEPDLIVHCGGVVEEGVVKDYELARDYLSELDSPIVYSPAGRDINYLGYDLFRKYFGEQDQEHSNGNILFKGVSTPQYDSTIGIVGGRERKELVEYLDNVSEEFKTIFLHHNVVPIPHSREKGLLEDAGDFLRDMVDAKVDLVLTGTSSHPYATKVGDTVIVNANSISSAYQRSLRGNSFNLIDIYDGAISVSEINSLWGKRHLLGIWERNGHI